MNQLPGPGRPTFIPMELGEDTNLRGSSIVENNDEVCLTDPLGNSPLPVPSRATRSAGADRVERGTQIFAWVVVAVLVLCLTGVIRDIEPPRDMIGPDEYAHIAAGRLR